MKRLLFLGGASLLLTGCASVRDTVVFWSRGSEIESAQASAFSLGIDVTDESYAETLKRWPYITRNGLQRRALLYSLLRSQNRSLAPWYDLSAEEDLSAELAQIAALRAAPHNVF